MALVRKILEATIPSGGSSATFTDSDIPNSLIRVYSTNSNIYPQNISLAGNTLTVTYEVVTSALGVAVELVKQGLEIDDNLISDNTDHALSAKQGKVLKGLIDDLDIPDNISELQDVDITDIEDGQVLAWDDTAEKFVNVNQSGGGTSQDYSTSEHVVGKWIDGTTDVYERTFVYPNTVTLGTYVSLSNDLSNIKYIISKSGCYFDISDSRCIALDNMRALYSETVFLSALVLDNLNVALALITGGTSYGSIKDIFITIRYIKNS